MESLQPGIRHSLTREGGHASRAGSKNGEKGAGGRNKSNPSGFPFIPFAGRIQRSSVATALIPAPSTGGMFEYVSGANFLGEIAEWAGFALAAGSVHSSAFAAFTAVVLSSRAVAHHK